MSVESRLRRIEKQLGIDRDDEIVEFPLNDGEVVRLTRRAFREILDDVMNRDNRFVPEGVKREQPKTTD